MKHCPNCGGEIGDEAKFCTWCGSAIAAVAAPVAAAAAISDPAPKPYSTPAPVQPTYPQTTYQQPTYPQTTYPAQQGSYVQPQQAYYTQSAAKKSDGLGTAAMVFLVLSVLINLYNAIGYSTLIGSDSSAAAYAVGYGISAVVTVIIAVLAIKKIRSKETISTGFKVVTLIFGSLIAGILLLVRKENQL